MELLGAADEMMRDPSGVVAASPNSKNLKGRVRMLVVVSKAAKFLDYIDLGIDITPRDSAITNPLLSAHSLLRLPVSSV